MADRNNTIKTEVVVDSRDAQKGVDQLADSAKGLEKGFDGAKSSVEKLDDASGGLLTRFKALAANPLGVVIAALVGLFKLLQGSVNRSGKATETFNKIGAKMSGIFNGILAVLEPVVEFIGEKFLNALNDPKQAIIDLGRAIQENIINRFKAFLVLGEAVSAILEGDIKRATQLTTDGFIQLATGVENATEKVTEFGEEASKRFEEAAKATDLLANAERRLVQNRIALEKQQLRSLRLAEDQRQIRDDESKSIEDRIAANRRLGEILDEQLKRELAIAQQNLNFARLRRQRDGDTIESLEAIGDAEIKLLEIQERINGQRSEQLTNENALLKEQEELKQKAIEEEEKRVAKEAELAKQRAEQERARLRADFEAQLELDELEIERRRTNGERTLELELALLEKKRAQDVSEADLTAKQIQAINERAEFESDKLRRIAEEAERKKEAAILKNTIDSAAEAFGVTQEVALARMIIAAPEAVGNSFKEAAATYAPPLSLIMGALGAAGVVAPIVQGIQQIKQTRFSGGRGGGSGASTPTPAVSGAGGGAAPAARNITPELVSDIAANNAARLGTDTDLGGRATATAAGNVTAGASSNVTFSEDRFEQFQNQVQFKEERTTI